MIHSLVVSPAGYTSCMTRPPIENVPVFARCPDCGQGFRGTICWAPQRPAYRRNRCPWCGTSILLGRDGTTSRS